jgi:uncharacterized protein YecT (DUF1311 family)
MRVVIWVGGAALALAGCDWMQQPKQSPRVESAKARLEQVRRACASKLTYIRLKEYVFDEAARIRNSDPRRLDTLAAQSVVRMEDPLVKSRDDDLNITVCTGKFVLDLPPGVPDAFDGRPLIEAEVEYAAQEALDGSGLVYSMTGAEPIIYRIATLGLSQRALPQITASTKAPIAAEHPVPANEPPLASAPRTPPPRPVPPETKIASSQNETAPRATKPGGRPSFNCRHARTPSERMVCGNGSLAAADRRMSAVYYSEMARADAQAKRALRQTRDRFLARRERCADAACVARVYEERVAEIRRLSGQ